MKELKCPCCGSLDFEETRLDRYCGILVRTVKCNDCNAKYSARYDFQYIMPDSIKKDTKLKNNQTGAEIVLAMLRSLEQNR